MKILYHHRIRSKDGQYVHIEELTAALREQGHEIVMVGPRIVDSGEFGDDAGIVAWLKKHIPQAVYELMELAYGFYDFVKLYRAARRYRPDCLYERYNLYTMGGVWVKRLCRLPMLLEVNSPICRRRAKYDGIALYKLAKWTENHVWRGADYVLPVTRVLADIMIRDGTPAGRVHIIPNGINPVRFPNDIGKDKAKADLGLEGRTVLGFVGFMRAWHGLDRIVDLVCLSERDDLHLLVVGDGPARKEVEERARAERVTFTGVVGRDELAPYIAAFDIAMQPDVVEYASPLKMFEYMHMGCAIVAPATDNIKEILEHGENALLFSPGDRQALRSAVETLVDQPALRDRLASAAAASVEARGFYWSTNARRVVQLFADLGVG